MPLSPAGMKASRPSSSRMMQPKRLQCNTLPRWCSTALLLGSGDRRGLYFDEDLVRFCQPELFVDERHEIFGSVQLLDPRAQILLAALQRRILALGLHDLSVQPDVFCTDAPYLSTNSAADEQQGNRKNRLAGNCRSADRYPPGVRDAFPRFARLARETDDFVPEATAPRCHARVRDGSRCAGIFRSGGR